MRPTLVIALVALALRLAHVWAMRATPYFATLLGDARGYDQWAQRLAAGEWIGTDVFYQAPLYPYFLGVLYALIGRDLLAVRLVQAGLGALSAGLVGYAAARWFGARAGWVAGLLLAAYAPAIFFDGLLQKSVLDGLFMASMLALVAALGTGAHDRKTLWLGLGVVLGALALTRENALVLVAVIGAWTWFGASSERLTRGTALALVAAGLAVVLVPVAARNAAVGGGFYLTTSQFGPNLYIGNHAGADGSYASLRAGRGTPEFEQRDATELAERATGRTLSPAEVSSYWTGRAIDFIRTDPAAWLALLARKTALLVNATEAIDTESQESHAEYSWPLRVLGPVTHFGVLVPLATLGLWVVWPDRRRVWVLPAMALALGAATVAFYVFARYRYPLAPILIVLAAAALSGMAEAWRTRPHAQAIGALASATTLAVVCQLPLVSSARNQAITETNLGVALHDEGRFDDAVQRYQRALAIEPDYMPAQNNLGLTLRAQGKVTDAIAVYEQALRRNDDVADLHYNLATALLDAGRAGEAAVHLRRAGREGGDAADVHNNLGTALAERGQFSEALAEFERALLLDPASALTERNVGNALAALERHADARAHFERAVTLAPGDARAHYDFGVFLLGLEDFDGAVRAFTRAITLEPGYAEAHNNLGIALGSQQRFDEAIAQFEEALRLQPGFPDAARNLDTVRQARRAVRPSP